MRVLLSILLAAGSLFGQAKGLRRPESAGVAANPADIPPPSVRAEDKCSIEGTVVNAVTGEPLKKAHLTLRPIGQANGVPYGTSTDSAGHFLVDDVDPGRYNFMATRNGFVSQQYSLDGSARRGTTLTLSNGQKLKDVVFKMTPQGVITGRILDEDGDPMSNVSVQCMVFGYQRGKRQLMPRNGSSTNDLGEFRLHDLPPGKYILSATYQSPEMYMGVQERTVGASQAVRAAEERYAPTYYPSATNPESASQIEITPGSQIGGINITLVRVRAVRIKGHVTNLAEGNSRRRVNVMLMPRDSPGFFMPRAIARPLDAQGNFQMQGVVPGSYLLRADYNEENRRYTARLPLEVGTSNIEGVELNLQPAAEISGHVVIEENGDLKGANLNIQLQPKVSGPMMGGGSAMVKDDLTFKLQNITPDPFDINVFSLPEGFYVKSIRLGQQVVTDTGADFSQGVTTEEMTIVLNPNGGQIDGTVQNAKGDPSAGTTITLIPDAEHQTVNSLYKVANTDQTGHFTIKGLRPGEYKIYAWEDIEPGAYQDPDFMKPHESAGEAVSVKEGSHNSVQLKAVPAEKSGSHKAGG